MKTILPLVSARSKLSVRSGTYSRVCLSGLTSTERPVAWGSSSACKPDALSLAMIFLSLRASVNEVQTSVGPSKHRSLLYAAFSRVDWPNLHWLHGEVEGHVSVLRRRS